MPASARLSHLCGMLFMDAIDVPMTTVPYKGTGPAMTDLLGGQVDMMCDQTTNTVTQIKTGKIKGYAVTTKDRLAVLPDLPTLDEAGLEGFEMTVWHGLYAPAGTPKEILDKLPRRCRWRCRTRRWSSASPISARSRCRPTRPRRRRSISTSRPRSSSGSRSSRRPASTPTDPQPGAVP